MKLHRIVHTAAKHLQLGIEDGFKLGRSIDVDGGCPSHKSEGGKHTHQSEAMVAMQMRDENARDTIEMDMGTTNRHLHAFPTIYHKRLAAYLYNLRGGQVFLGGQSTSASQYMYFEWLHYFCRLYANMPRLFSM